MRFVLTLIAVSAFAVCPQRGHAQNSAPLKQLPASPSNELTLALTLAPQPQTMAPSPRATTVPGSSRQPQHKYVDPLLYTPPLGISDRLGPLRVHGLHAQEALQDISRKANVVIGLQEVVYKTDAQISFDFAGGTVADLLNAFVARAPDYQWQNDDGVIHVFRNGAHVPLADVVLDYPGTTNKIRRELWSDLHSRPEYRAWMSSNRCHPYEQFHPMDFKFHEGDISIPAGQITIAQFLDQVATKSHANFWAVLQSAPSEPSCFASVILWPAPPTTPK